MGHSREGYEQVAEEYQQEQNKDKQLESRLEEAGDQRDLGTQVAVKLEQYFRDFLIKPVEKSKDEVEAYIESGHEEALQLNAEYEQLRGELEEMIRHAGELETRYRNSSGYGRDRMHDVFLDTMDEARGKFQRFLQVRAVLNGRTVNEEKQIPKDLKSYRDLLRQQNSQWEKNNEGLGDPLLEFLDKILQ